MSGTGATDVLEKNPFLKRSILLAKCPIAARHVAATPPCTATPSKRQLEAQHPFKSCWKGRCYRDLFRKCSAILLATPLQILENIVRQSVARQDYCSGWATGLVGILENQTWLHLWESPVCAREYRKREGCRYARLIEFHGRLGCWLVTP